MAVTWDSGFSFRANRQASGGGSDHVRSKPAAFSVERGSYPFDISSRCPREPHLFDGQWDDFDSADTSISCRDVYEIHQGEIVAVLFEAADAFIVVQEVTATVKDQPVSVDFERLRVM